MAALILPTRTDLRAYNMRVQLQGRTYSMTFLWNVREEYWYFTLADEKEDPILSGKKIVANWPLLRGVTDARRPPGELVAFDSTNTGDPGVDELGPDARVQLMYDEAG